MFERGGVRLRPLELTDLDRLFAWSRDPELEALSGWGPVLPRAAFERRWAARIEDPPDEARFFAIDVEGEAVGRLDLALIDRVHRRAAVGLFIGEARVRGRGVGTQALVLGLDYAFSLEGMERVVAEVYTFNHPARRLMERVGFQPEGTLRGHDLHQGRRQDVWVYGILAREFFGRHGTLFQDPGAG